MYHAATDAFVCQAKESPSTEVREELYDQVQDPYALNNLVDTPEVQDTLTRMRDQMTAELTNQKDLFASAYREYLASREPTNL